MLRIKKKKIGRSLLKIRQNHEPLDYLSCEVLNAFMFSKAENVYFLPSQKILSSLRFLKEINALQLIYS